MTNTIETMCITDKTNNQILGQAVISGDEKISNISQSNFLLEGIYSVNFEKIKEIAEKRAYKEYGENIEIKYSQTQ